MSSATRDFIFHGRNSNGGGGRCCMLSASPGHTASLQARLWMFDDCSDPSTMGTLSAAQLLPAVVLPLSCTSSRTFYKTVLPSLTQCAHSPAQDGWPALALLATDRSKGGGDTHSSAQDDPFLLSRLTLSGPDFPVGEIQFPHSNCPATKKNQNQMRTLLNAASHTSFFFSWLNNL